MYWLATGLHHHVWHQRYPDSPATVSRCTQIGSSALSVQLQTKSSELTYASQQLGWSSGKAERVIA
jgi:hypothetical protein